MPQILDLDWKEPVILSVYAVCFILLLGSLYKVIKRRCSPGYTGPFLFRRRTGRRLLGENNPDNASPGLQCEGLASAIIQSLPAVQFREKTKQSDDGSGACSICLGKFGEGEWLRLLPNCAHIFHISCIDPWFRSHSTCPLCRTDVLYASGSNFDSPASANGLLGTLPRENTYQGRPLGYSLLESEAVRNQELRWEAVRGNRPGSDSGESFPQVGMAPSSMASTSQMPESSSHQ
ncbi:RING-H2 finger protein ATL80-like [Phoenix dactylifera]|uniref:RING-type E3 ubiquitin transferase n=1 Tax=Phoenix dactylifera TaxID=42345 RepID=A0A8B7MTR1_PHODC|nr:RING-H2 finger protein ATL80-like [Phoenix dactylifera]